MKLDEIREEIKKEIREMKERKKRVILEIHENQMRYPIDMIYDLYNQERDFEKKIIDLQIKEVESILSWIESNESSEDSDGYLHMKYSEKLKYLSQIQSNLRD